MNGIFGWFSRSGAPISMELLNNFLNSAIEIKSVNRYENQEKTLVIGTFSKFAGNNNGFVVKDRFDLQADHQVFASARLDNRSDLVRDLNLSETEANRLSDSDLLAIAHDRWGEHCCEHLYGDWVFACWNSRTHDIWVARDHFGMTSLYYYLDGNNFIFTTNRKILLSLNIVAKDVDKDFLARLLVGWDAYHGSKTAHSSISRLPPAHHVTVSRSVAKVQQYWYLERIPELQFAKRSDYVDAFREVFDNAVRSRISSSLHLNDKLVCTTLSGGLDSSSVTATTAMFLKDLDKRITSYTSVPIFDTSPFTQKRFGDEFPYARKVAQFLNNVDHQAIKGVLTPIQAIRQSLTIHDEPLYSAGNQYWLLDIMSAAQSAGAGKLLVGQFGNAGVSWTGSFHSQSLLWQIRSRGLAKVFKSKLSKIIPYPLKCILRGNIYNTVESSLNYSPVNAAFAKLTSVFEQRFEEAKKIEKTNRLSERLFLKPGRNCVGSLYAEKSAYFNLEILDPTADARVLEFVFAVPDRIFIDPETGMDRWLIREAMKGRLPEDIRLNCLRGRQAGDIVPRLRTSASEVDGVLSELTNGPAAEYLNINAMYNAWQVIKTDDTPNANILAITVLTRGIMAGLFVNHFEGGL